MSEKIINNVKELSRSMLENSARVETKISRPPRPNPYTEGTRGAVVKSAAKYHEALERLAKE